MNFVLTLIIRYSPKPTYLATGQQKKASIQ